MAYLGNDLSTIIKQGKVSYKFVATAGQTVITGSDANGVPLACSANTFVNVFLNGVRLIKGDDFTLGTDTVTLLSALSADDEVIIVTDIESATFDSYTKAETDAKYMDINTETLPSQTGNSGKYLTTDGSNSSWGTVDLLPDQSANSGKYLTTDGTTPSWGTISTVFPFYKADGSSDTITITNGSMPFYKADGSQDNIGVS
jgi:hypothetical protein